MKRLKSLYKVVFVATLVYASVCAWSLYRSKGKSLEKKEVEKVQEVQGEFSLIEPPKPIIKHYPSDLQFPAHWGPPPRDLGNGGTYLPEPFGGWGSYELVIWILENQKHDLKNK